MSLYVVFEITYCDIYVIDGHFMLIDADENDKGGLDVVINNFDVETLIIPEKEHTTKTFEDKLCSSMLLFAPVKTSAI